MHDFSSLIIEVAIPLHLDATFHYRITEQSARQMEIGKRVFVPFGRRKLTGYVIGAATDSDRELREILGILDESPLFTPKELAFYRWIAAYYLHPLGEVIRTALPAGINIQARKCAGADSTAAETITGGQKIRTETVYSPAGAAASSLQLRGKGLTILAHLREVGTATSTDLRSQFGTVAPQLRRLIDLGLVSTTEREVYRDPFRQEVYERDTPLTLNDSQSAALSQITGALDENRFAPFLLHGITGSGKTEVYLQAIAHAAALGKTALVMVPEIALTPQLVNRFKRRFSCGIAVLHSALSEGERYDEWRRIRRNEVTIVIGARSALFAPLDNLGIIVVDEEHEASYKQSEGLRYNARDMALVRGKLSGACVLLGSATPLITTFHAAREGKLGYLSLPRRVRDLPLPTTELIDGRGRKREMLSSRLKTALQDNLAQNGQTLLFLNRRGFATFLICEECGHLLQCPNCSVTLTYHRRLNRHCCHYCDYSLPAPSLCPSCHGDQIVLLGHGTERIEESVRELFPEARVDRMDRDTTSGRGGHNRVLRKVADLSTDILIGTQMIAKGHHFPEVTLVGIVSVDATLNLPDFRSAERGFQLVSQLIGRAGRGDRPGQVLIQSLIPDHYALSHAATHDYEGFYATELNFREETGYPPFSYLAAISLSGNSPTTVKDEAATVASLLRSLSRELAARIEILGPAQPPLAKIRGRHRWQLLIKSRDRSALHRLLTRCKTAYTPAPAVRMHIDVDPVNLL